MSDDTELESADLTPVPPQAADLTDLFRDFESALWAHINAPDTPEARRDVAVWVAGELARIQANVDTELEIVS